MNADEREPQTMEENDQESKGTSRGEFLKWGTIALSGMYVGPRITTFAVRSQLGHAGSVPPSPTAVTPSPTPTTPTVPNLPATGGAADKR